MCHHKRKIDCLKSSSDCLLLYRAIFAFKSSPLRLHSHAVAAYYPGMLGEESEVGLDQCKWGKIDKPSIKLLGMNFNTSYKTLYLRTSNRDVHLLVPVSSCWSLKFKICVLCSKKLVKSTLFS